MRQFKRNQWQLVRKPESLFQSTTRQLKDLCDAQSVFMQKTQEMQVAVKDENIFLDIIRQVQLPAVQVNEECGRGTPRQDVPGADTYTTPPQLQEAATECDRPDKNHGCIHILCFV